jgi:hypothetical protein
MTTLNDSGTFLPGVTLSRDMLVIKVWLETAADDARDETA